MFFGVKRLVVVMRMRNGKIDARRLCFCHANLMQQELPLVQVSVNIDKIVSIVDEHGTVRDGTNPESVASVAFKEACKFCKKACYLLACLRLPALVTASISTSARNHKYIKQPHRILHHLGESCHYPNLIRTRRDCEPLCVSCARQRPRVFGNPGPIFGREVAKFIEGVWSGWQHESKISEDVKFMMRFSRNGSYRIAPYGNQTVKFDRMPSRD